jgi:hypothetical protein
MRLKPKAGDWVLAGLILAVMFLVPLVFAQQNTGLVTAVVEQNGAEIARIRLSGLSEAVRVDYAGQFPGAVRAENGRIRFEAAKCPDQICVHTGWISNPGQTAACLPARVLIRLEGTPTGDVDVRLR